MASDNLTEAEAAKGFTEDLKETRSNNDSDSDSGSNSDSDSDNLTEAEAAKGFTEDLKETRSNNDSDSDSDSDNLTEAEAAKGFTEDLKETRSNNDSGSDSDSTSGGGSGSDQGGSTGGGSGSSQGGSTGGGNDSPRSIVDTVTDEVSQRASQARDTASDVAATATDAATDAVDTAQETARDVTPVKSEADGDGQEGGGNPVAATVDAVSSVAEDATDATVSAAAGADQPPPTEAAAQTRRGQQGAAEAVATDPTFEPLLNEAQVQQRRGQRGAAEAVTQSQGRGGSERAARRADQRQGPRDLGDRFVPEPVENAINSTGEGLQSSVQSALGATGGIQSPTVIPTADGPQLTGVGTEPTAVERGIGDVATAPFDTATAATETAETAAFVGEGSLQGPRQAETRTRIAVDEGTQFASRTADFAAENPARFTSAIAAESVAGGAVARTTPSTTRVGDAARRTRQRAGALRNRVSPDIDIGTPGDGAVASRLTDSLGRGPDRGQLDFGGGSSSGGRSRGGSGVDLDALPDEVAGTRPSRARDLPTDEVREQASGIGESLIDRTRGTDTDADSGLQTAPRFQRSRSGDRPTGDLAPDPRVSDPDSGAIPETDVETGSSPRGLSPETGSALAVGSDGAQSPTTAAIDRVQQSQQESTSVGTDGTARGGINADAATRPSVGMDSATSPLSGLGERLDAGVDSRTDALQSPFGDVRGRTGADVRTDTRTDTRTGTRLDARLDLRTDTQLNTRTDSESRTRTSSQPRGRRRTPDVDLETDAGESRRDERSQGAAFDREVFDTVSATEILGVDDDAFF